MILWFDATRICYGNSVFETRDELDLAMALKVAYPQIRFCIYTEDGFIELSLEDVACIHSENEAAFHSDTKQRQKEQIYHAEIAILPKLEEACAYSKSRRMRFKKGIYLLINALPRPIRWLIWVFEMVSLASGKLVFFLKRLLSRIGTASGTPSAYENAINTTEEAKNIHFTYEDRVITVGQLCLNRQRAYTAEQAGLIVNYVVNSAPVIEDSKLLLSEEAIEAFQSYINWISVNCKLLLYSNDIIKESVVLYQKLKTLPLPNSVIVHKGMSTDGDWSGGILESLGVKGQFILVVGDVDPIHNYDVIYKAFAILVERNSDVTIPTLVLVGDLSCSNGCSVLYHNIRTDPRVCQRIIAVDPRDTELDYLYRNCMFYVSASLNEMSDQFFARASQYHKVGLLSDTWQTRTLYGEHAVYADPFDPMTWANMIEKITKMPKSRPAQTQYRPISWADSAYIILDIIVKV